MLTKKILLVLLSTITSNTFNAQAYYEGYTSPIIADEITEGMKESNGSFKCPICLSEITDITTLCKANCNSEVAHIFCKYCLIQNIKSENILTCPICRQYMHEPISELFKCINTGNTEAVKQILENKIAHPNSISAYGSTPLMDALKHNDFKMAQMLIDKGSNLQYRDIDGNTLLNLACQANYPQDSILFLIRKGADVNSTDKDGNTPLIKACEAGNTEIVQCLMLNGANVNATNNYGSTPLIKSCQCKNGDIPTVRLLLSNEVINVNATDNIGNTPLLLAIKNKNIKLIKLLLCNVIIRDQDTETQNSDTLSDCLANLVLN